MELTVSALNRVLAVCCGDEPESASEVVHVVRHTQHSFAPTLYAAWERDGATLNPALRYELDVQRRRTERYREIAAGIAGMAGTASGVPAVVPLKGLEVADLYPAGWVRYMNDLDYVVADERDLWSVVNVLVGDGWELHSGTFVNLGGQLQVLVSLRREHEDRYCLPYGIELATFVAMGNLAGVPAVITLPRAWRDSAVKNLLMLLFERFEQRYRARDLVDATLLLGAVGRSGWATLWPEIDRLGLWPEYRELAGLLRRAELADAPVPGRPLGTAAADSRTQRVVTELSGWRRPVDGAARHLQRRMMYGRLSRSERWLWSVAERRLHPGRALRAGLHCFGLPVPDGRPDVAVATLTERPEVTWVDTPAGRFVLTVGDELDQDALDAVPPWAPAAAPGRPTADPVR